MAPRAVSGIARADPQVVSRLEIPLPRDSWMGGFSRRHPDLVLTVHNSMPIDRGRVVGEFGVSGHSRDWSGEIEAFPDVFGVERMQLPSSLTRYRVLSVRSPFFRPISDLAILLNYPRTIQDGVFSCETVAHSSQVRRLIAAMRTPGRRVRITSIRPVHTKPMPRVVTRVSLTPVQQRLFSAALELGYFEVPRRITLSHLAERMGRSKSSVSHALALVERKLAHWAGDPSE